MTLLFDIARLCIVLSIIFFVSDLFSAYNTRNIFTEILILSLWMGAISHVAAIIIRHFIPAQFRFACRDRENLCIIGIGAGIGGATSVWILDVLFT